jgi:hypothetical protein
MCVLAGIVAFERVKQEVIMQILTQKATPQEPATDTATCRSDASRRMLHFVLGAQRIIFEEMVFTAEAMLERMRIETHLYGEFAAKLASSHSVQDWKAMGSECSQHQLEFARREYERVFRHGEQLIERASNWLNSQE